MCMAEQLYTLITDRKRGETYYTLLNAHTDTVIIYTTSKIIVDTVIRLGQTEVTVVESKSVRKQNRY